MQGEGVVGNHPKARSELFVGMGGHPLPLVEDESRRGFYRQIDQEVDSARPTDSERHEIEVDTRDLRRILDMQLELLNQLAAQRLYRRFAGIERSAKEAPMVRIPDIGTLIPQLHEIPAVAQPYCRGGGSGNLGIRRNHRITGTPAQRVTIGMECKALRGLSVANAR